MFLSQFEKNLNCRVGSIKTHAYGVFKDDLYESILNLKLWKEVFPKFHMC